MSTGDYDFKNAMQINQFIDCQRRIAEARAAEREACAGLAESMIGASRREIAAAIRARGEK